MHDENDAIQWGIEYGVPSVVQIKERIISMKPIRPWPVTAAVVLLAGCVIIPDTFEAHIVIDIRYIEEHAEEVLDYIEGKSDVLPGLGGETSESSMLDRTLDFLKPIRPVYAEALITSSSRVEQIAKKMKGRHEELTALKRRGGVGENNRGLVELARPEVHTDAEDRNAAQRLVAAENEDRKALYLEIARLNKESALKIATLEAVYAKQRIQRAKAGGLFQLPVPGGDFDAFKASTAGRRLGAECIPGAWVILK